MPAALSDFAIRSAKPRTGPDGKPAITEIPDGGMRGLYLVIYGSGAKAWALRYRRKSDSKPRKFTLGQVGPLDSKATPRENVVIGQPLSLAEARRLAAEQLHYVALGGDPAAKRKVEKRALKEAAKQSGNKKANGDPDLLENIVADFLERHASKRRTASETERLFNKEVLPHWRGRRVQEITKRDVILLLDQIVDSGRGTTANRVLAAVRKLFNWCIDRDVVEMSPCAGVKAPAEETARDRVLGDDEIRWLWQACDEVGQPFGPFVKLLILTAQRREEVGGIRFDELALDNNPPSWNIPATRAKNGREQFVPLSGLAVEIISSVNRIAGRVGYLFTTTGTTSVSGFSRAKAKFDRVMTRIAREETGDADLAIPHWTFHDIRRSCATQLQQLGFPIETVEAVLNHRSGVVSGVAAVYARHDYAKEKQLALDALARRVEEIVSDEPASAAQFQEAR